MKVSFFLLSLKTLNIDLIHNLDTVTFFIYPDLPQILDKKSLLTKWLPE